MRDSSVALDMGRLHLYRHAGGRNGRTSERRPIQHDRHERIAQRTRESWVSGFRRSNGEAMRSFPDFGKGRGTGERRGVPDASHAGQQSLRMAVYLETIVVG